MNSGSDVHSLSRLGPLCPVPDRISHSHWMSHIPFAFWLIDVLRPKIFVELGAYTGVSFCAFCQQIAALQIPCEAYAIDSWQGDANMGTYPESVYEDLADYIEGRYSSFASLIKSSFADACKQFENESLDLLHIDGCHSETAMLTDLEMWLPKMSKRGVILMHDIKARLPGYGGISAWKKISAEFPSFAFTHGYGLGLLLPGNESPETLQALTRLNESEQALFADRFRKQAPMYEKLFWLEQKRKAENKAACEAASAAATKAARHVAEVRTALSDENEKLRQILETERLDHLNERLRMQEQLAASVLKANAFETSLSWKLTAPLRKVARLLRN